MEHALLDVPVLPTGQAGFADAAISSPNLRDQLAWCHMLEQPDRKWSPADSTTVVLCHAQRTPYKPPVFVSFETRPTTIDVGMVRYWVQRSHG